MTDEHHPDIWTDPWPAPQAPGPVRASVVVPGSKSLTNRALVLAALADRPTRPSDLRCGLVTAS